MLTISELIYCKNLIEITLKRKAYTQEEIKYVNNFYRRIQSILRPYFIMPRIAAALVVVNAIRTSIKFINSAKDIQRISRGFLIRKLKLEI